MFYVRAFYLSLKSPVFSFWYGKYHNISVDSHVLIVALGSEAPVYLLEQKTFSCFLTLPHAWE